MCWSYSRCYAVSDRCSLTLFDAFLASPSYVGAFQVPPMWAHHCAFPSATWFNWYSECVVFRLPVSRSIWYWKVSLAIVRNRYLAGVNWLCGRSRGCWFIELEVSGLLIFLISIRHLPGSPPWINMLLCQVLWRHSMRDFRPQGTRSLQHCSRWLLLESHLLTVALLLWRAAWIIALSVAQVIVEPALLNPALLAVPRLANWKPPWCASPSGSCVISAM